MIYKWTALMLITFTLAACGGGDDSSVEPEAATDVAAPAPAGASDPVEKPAEDETSVALPEGFPENIPMIEGFVVESAETKDAATNQFTVVGHAPMDEVKVMEWYANRWNELGWDEDMLMEQHGNTIVSYIKDGLVVVVDSVPAPGGSRVTMTTGNV